MAHEPMNVGGANAPGASILLVDADDALGAELRELFGRNGMHLEAVRDARRGLSRALQGGHDLILLELPMPGFNGIELLHLLRRRSPVPLIAMAAGTSPADRVAVLDAGADDYLPKPFGTEELLARVRAVLRRADASWRLRAAEALELGPIRLAPGSRETWCDGRAIGLTAIEFDILELLLRSAGRAVSRDELMTLLHHRRVTPFDRSLDVHISHIRKKLGRRGCLIRTVRGVGYFFGVESRSNGGPGR